MRAEVRLIDEEDLRPSSLRLRQQCGARLDKGGSLLLVGLEEALLRPLVDAAQPVQGAQASTAAEPNPAAILDASPHHLPIPVRQIAADLRRRDSDGDGQSRSDSGLQGGGSPVCSEAQTAESSRSEAANQLPIVWGSCPNRSVTLFADHP